MRGCLRAGPALSAGISHIASQPAADVRAGYADAGACHARASARFLLTAALVYCRLCRRRWGACRRGAASWKHSWQRPAMRRPRSSCWPRWTCWRRPSRLQRQAQRSWRSGSRWVGVWQRGKVGVCSSLSRGCHSHRQSEEVEQRRNEHNAVGYKLFFSLLSAGFLYSAG